MCCTKTTLLMMVALMALLLPDTGSGAEAVQGGDALAKVKLAKQTIETNERLWRNGGQGLLEPIIPATRKRAGLLAKSRCLNLTASPGTVGRVREIRSRTRWNSMRNARRTARSS